jgi:DNA gyrase inhibitor GyrI
MQEFRLLSTMVIIGSALALLGCRATRSGYESAPYQVVKTDGKFEVRDYPVLMVVETAMARGGQDGDGSFNRLFGFITGKNEAKQKIAMTTPVFMSGSDSNRTMAFVLPAPLKSAAVPRPADGAVTVRELPAGRFAVLRFSGARSAEQEALALGQLQAWMESRGLKGALPPVYGYFDPPWTPSALRRNEVMIQTVPGT